ncbi:MAG TPA: thiamine diphosphokinase, partial [Anaerolineae bacterium]|nr:thiamine diphosphokinase [Anaerolineae bacterium]
ALRVAQRLQPEEVILLGALGGRLDQTLANIFLLAHPDYADLRVTLVSGPERAWVMRDEIVVRGRPGDLLSVIPLTPDVTGLTYHHGLRWRLTDAVMPFGSSRGVSNELVAEEARLSLKTGVALVIHRESNR